MTYNHAAFVETIASRSASRATTQSNTLLHAKALDSVTTSTCMQFFQGFNTPSTLIAGSSFVALFALANHVQDTSYVSKRKIFFLRLYHVFSLLTFCLSMTTVMSSQAAMSRLLFAQEAPHKIVDAYMFLRSRMNLEFLLCRWSFLTSIFCFLQSTLCRMLFEFDLFSRRRRTASVMLVSMMISVVMAILSSTYKTSCSYPISWVGMTKELGMVGSEFI
jgi:hypothetical protein